MTYELAADGVRRLEAYFEGIGTRLGEKRRRASFALYAMGILGEHERKSVEPLAAAAADDPEGAQRTHDHLLHFIGQSEWEDGPIRQLAARYAVHAMESRERISAWVIDDTGFMKQGRESPGVQRQYTGSVGKIANCQIGVSLTLCTPTEHVPVDMQLYLPESWTNDRARCDKAKIPRDVEFRTKWQIASTPAPPIDLRPGHQSERGRQSVQVRRADLPQRHQHAHRPEPSTKRAHPRRHIAESLGHQALDRHERAERHEYPPPKPHQRRPQRHRVGRVGGTHLVGHLLQARRVLGLHRSFLDHVQRARHPTRVEVRQEPEARVLLAAHVPSHVRHRRHLAHVRAQPLQVARPRLAQRACRQSCRLPAPLGNVLLEGLLGR